jgi:sortase A
MRRAVAVGLVVCGLAVLSWQWIFEPVSSLRTEQAQSQLLRQVPGADSAAGAGVGPGVGVGVGVGVGAGGSGVARAADGRTADTVAGETRAGAARARVARPVAPGEALAVMRIPRFGADWRWAVSEGVTQKVLTNGPGHYPGTPLPGRRGNSAYAAHRAGHGDPFIDFDRLRPGDLVHLSQGDTAWTYRLDRRPLIIPTSASWVLNPLPGRRLTLTTCWPKYGSAKRMYVTGRLVDTTT